MRKLVLCLLMLPVSTFLFAQIPNSKVKWVTLQQAQALQKIEYKPILVDVYTNWSESSWLLAASFEHPTVTDYVNKNFYPVRFNAESEKKVRFAGTAYMNPDFDESLSENEKNALHDLTTHWGVNSFPRVLVFDKYLQLAKRIDGFRGPGDLHARLRQSEVLAAK